MKAAALEGSMLSLSDDLLVLDDVHCADLPRLPLQMGFLLIGMCTSGSADFRLSGREHHIEKGGAPHRLGRPGAGAHTLFARPALHLGTDVAGLCAGLRDRS